MTGRSLRFRLSLWNCAVLAAALLGFGAGVGYALQASISEAIDRDLAARVESLLMVSSPSKLASVGPGLFPSGTPAAASTPEARRYRGWRLRHGDPGERRAWALLEAGLEPEDAQAARGVLLLRPRVLKADGRTAGGFSDDRPLDPAGFRTALRGQAVSSDVRFAGGHVRVLSQPFRRRGEVNGVVQVGRDLAELDRLRETLFRTGLVVGPLALLVACGGGLFLTGRALRPLGEVSRAAAEISEQDLSCRLPVSGDDEMAQLATTFNSVLARLEEAFRRQESTLGQVRRFTEDVSHELRTPLTRLKGGLDLALSGSPSVSDYQRALVAASATAEGMHRLVQDLLLLARSDAGQLRPLLRPIDLAEVIETAVDGLALPYGQAVVLELPSTPVRLWADASQLSRLLANLLENAVRHTPAGGAVTVAARREGEWVVVTVSDTGEGIPPEHLAHVLERFYRIDPARDRARGGTGLGLSIVSEIVQAHSGEIAIESRPGEGTTVRVVLPREPGAGVNAEGRVPDANRQLSSAA